MLTQADFAGVWLLRRQIDDLLSKQTGKFDGTATLSDDTGGGLIYYENGTMQLGDGPVMTAERRYLWVFGTVHIDVAFANGAPFHRFTPAGHLAGTDHPCGADFYTVRYDFTAWPVWSAVWTVTGPRKDYVSTSVYTLAPRPSIGNKTST
jgi:hypothetical protein